jgi:hypothetical protein
VASADEPGEREMEGVASLLKETEGEDWGVCVCEAVCVNVRVAVELFDPLSVPVLEGEREPLREGVRETVAVLDSVVDSDAEPVDDRVGVSVRVGEKDSDAVLLSESEGDTDSEKEAEALTLRESVPDFVLLAEREREGVTLGLTEELKDATFKGTPGW